VNKVDKSYEIEIEVSDVGGTYTAGSLEEAQEIAEDLCNEIYMNLDGNCTVRVLSVTEK
jgi:F420-0:gamma-glutamyl ligase-like protein